MDSALIDETSQQYLGKWKRLVSTTNWDKGRIIYEWRQALVASDAPSSEYSDDAWSQRVRGITPQHVGRLRRVFERFAAVSDQYEGLYWSHFQAALDWEDAEMWLEGAVQNLWSISEMRAKRYETLGEVEGAAAEASEVDPADWDDDLDTLDDTDAAPFAESAESEFDSVAQARPYRGEGAGPAEPDFPRSSADAEVATAAAGDGMPEPLRPFANLPQLPDDVGEAFESFKLSILRHKLSGWQEISRDDLVATLDALKELALAPAVG